MLLSWKNLLTAAINVTMDVTTRMITKYTNDQDNLKQNITINNLAKSGARGALMLGWLILMLCWLTLMLGWLTLTLGWLILMLCWLTLMLSWLILMLCWFTLSLGWLMLMLCWLTLSLGWLILMLCWLTLMLGWLTLILLGQNTTFAVLVLLFLTFLWSWKGFTKSVILRASHLVSPNLVQTCEADTVYTLQPGWGNVCVCVWGGGGGEGYLCVCFGS